MPVATMIGSGAAKRKNSFQRAAEPTRLTLRGGDRMPRLEAIVHGLVQGVFFRHHTCHQAQSLGLAGTVENRPDGTVHVIAEGERESLEKLCQWLHVGPDLAVVERVDVLCNEPTGAWTDFRITR
jgi:acylphosphatase